MSYDQWKQYSNEGVSNTKECDCGKHIPEDKDFCSDRCWRINNES